MLAPRVHRPLSGVLVLGLGLAAVSSVWADSSAPSGGPAAEPNGFEGRWLAPSPHRGVVIALTMGTTNALIFPGTGPDRRTEALTLKLRNLKTVGRAVTFTVDFPFDEGTADFEFRLDESGERGTLRLVRIDGEPADANRPTWILLKAAEARPLAVLSAQLVADVAESAARQESSRRRMVKLAVPETRGEMVRVTVAIGELTTRLADGISDARRRRAERKAREMVERDLQNFLAQHAAK